MFVYILVIAALLLIAAAIILNRIVRRLDTKREVLHFYESVDWNSEAAQFIRAEANRMKWSIISWVSGLLLIQTVIIFLAIIYVLENAG